MAQLKGQAQKVVNSGAKSSRGSVVYPHKGSIPGPALF